MITHLVCLPKVNHFVLIFGNHDNQIMLNFGKTQVNFILFFFFCFYPYNLYYNGL